MSRLGRIFVLPTVEELQEEEEFLNKRWSDFDHGQSQSLGLQRSLHPTQLIFERNMKRSHVLQSCSQANWTDARAKLIEVARKSNMFVSPSFMFVDQSNVYVGSEVAYSTDGQPALTLADMIDSTLPIMEMQAAAVLEQVIRALLVLEDQELMYGRVKASNIFPSRDGQIRLAAFGTHLEPEMLRSHNSGCEELGHLANHMLTRIPRLLDKAETRDKKWLLKTRSSRIELDIKGTIGTSYLDFLEACMDPDSTLESLSKHKFLIGGPGPRCLGANVRHAELTVLRF